MKCEVGSRRGGFNKQASKKTNNLYKPARTSQTNNLYKPARTRKINNLNKLASTEVCTRNQ